MKKNDSGFLAYMGRSFARLLLGGVAGMLSALPFFNNRAFSETFRMDCVKWKARNRIARRWSYLIGGLLGFFFFFLVPVRDLQESYPLAISCLILGFALVFGIYEIYTAYRQRSRKHMPSSILLFLVFLAIPLVLHFYPIPAFDLAETSGIIALFLVFLLSSFLVFFTGISVGSILFLSSNYLAFSDRMATISRLELEGNDYLLVAALLGGLVLGMLLSLLFRRFPLNMEKSSINAGLYVGILVTIAAFEIKEPYFTDVTSSEMAQLFVFLAFAIASLGIAVAFTYHVYPFLNRDERKEEDEMERPALVPEQVSSFSLSAYYRDLLLRDIFLPYPEVETKEKEQTSSSVSGLDLDKLRKIQEEMKNR